jgi:hypothetical protein
MEFVSIIILKKNKKYLKQILIIIMLLEGEVLVKYGKFKKKKQPEYLQWNKCLKLCIKLLI